MKLALSKKEFWDSQTARMKEKGLIENDGLTYDKIKSFYESREFEISINQNFLIRHEMKMIEPVLACLLKRNWCFASAPKGLQYICSDDPVVLSWAGDENAMGFWSPGHGMKGTIVIFPLSSELILIGQFESLPEQIIHSATQVTATNTHIARYSTKQVYARDGSFLINLLNRDNVRGEDLPKFYGRET